MNDYANAITGMEAELAELESRRGLLTRAIEGLRALGGRAVDATPAVEPPARVIETRRASSSTKPTKATKSQPGELTDVQIVAEVERRQPVSAKVICEALNTTNYRLKRLVDGGLLVATGNTTTRRFSVAGIVPVATIPEPAALDAAVLQRLKVREETFAGLASVVLPSRSDDAHTALKRSLRRLSLKGAIRDVGERFRAA